MMTFFCVCVHVLNNKFNKPNLASLSKMQPRAPVVG